MKYAENRNCNEKEFGASMQKVKCLLMGEIGISMQNNKMQNIKIAKIGN